MCHSKRTIISVFLFLTIFSAGCGDLNVGVVTPIGGCIYGPEDVSICFPAQSLKSAAAFRISVLENEPDSVMEPFTHAYQLNPNTPLLVKPARVTIPISSVPEPPSENAVLAIFVQSSPVSPWQEVKTDISPSSISARINRLSRFVVLWKQSNKTSCKEGDTRSCYTGPSGTRGKGVCLDGRQTCGPKGKWGSCQGSKVPTKEVCGDGKDNDCDGKSDENCTTCVDGETRSCGNNKGACQGGTQVCKSGAWGSCQGGVGPAQEVCDGNDNDCDGTVDEGLTRECKKGCNKGRETCSNGLWKSCTAPPAAAEVCDGKDNDCDGVVDNGCECRPGQTKLCGSGKGVCKHGSRTCQADGTWGSCKGSIAPSTEVCDGKDNDCDGLTDESLTKFCKTSCGKGSQICNKGTWLECSAPQPAKEICDGKDNDCDGKTDEDFKLNVACTGGKGACKASGVTVCDRTGAGVVCKAPSPPATKEICDGADNDCDGIVDEGCQCVYGTTQPCGNDAGTCKKGVRTCLSNGWTACLGEVKATAEVCDGKDNDCDGKTDEGCPCVVGATRNCGTDQGACSKGTQVCLTTGWGPCSGGVKVSTEVCDGRDNDCDGLTDENLKRSCNNACGQGWQVCNSGLWGECSSPQPVVETCNGKDDDCDGLTDENLTKSCSTDCGSGSQICLSGVWSLCNAPMPTFSEICNNKDDDCDGLVDEHLIRTCTTVCGLGYQTCSKGGWGACSSGQPVPEVCKDKKDNDCDGLVDEGC